MMIIAVFVLCTVLTSQVDAQVLQFGTCPEVATVKLFDVERFLGTWYVIQRFPAWFEDKGACAYKRIQACGRRIEFQHIFIRDDIQYILHVNSSYNPGDEAEFKFEANTVDPIGIPLLVVDTDYSEYAILYGCKVNSILNIKYALAWILSRNTTLPEDVLKTARKTLTAIPNTSYSYLEEIRHDPQACSHQWTAHIQAVNTTNTDE